MGIGTLPFRFGNSDLPAPPALVALVPAGIGSKEALLEALADRLQFPDYFGGNWDALWECIRDLSWLQEGPVVIQHEDIPLTNDIANLKIYLSLLRDAVQKKWAPQGQDLRDLAVTFPADGRDRISWLLDIMDSEDTRK